MKAKTNEPAMKSKDEERFYQFARALVAVPKKELDKELAINEKRPSQSKKTKSR